MVIYKTSMNLKLLPKELKAHSHPRSTCLHLSSLSWHS